MKILEELQMVCNAHSIPMEGLAISYAPNEGLCAWWIKSAVGNGFKYPEFVVEALEFSKGWWLRREFDEMDWSCAFVHDEDHVDLGPYPFKMPLKAFMDDHYQVLWNSEYNECRQTCNAVNVNYYDIAHKKGLPAPQRQVHQTAWRGMPTVSFIDFLNGANLAHSDQVRSRRDGDKFYAYNAMQKMMFDGFSVRIYDDAQREIIRRILNNKDDFIRLLRNF